MERTHTELPGFFPNTWLSQSPFLLILSRSLSVGSPLLYYVLLILLLFGNILFPFTHGFLLIQGFCPILQLWTFVLAVSTASVMDTFLYLLFIQNQSLMTLSGRQVTFWASLILDSSLLLHGRAFISNSIYSSLNLILVGNVLPLD